jgi:hypothetical protein
MSNESHIQKKLKTRMKLEKWSQGQKQVKLLMKCP